MRIGILAAEDSWYLQDLVRAGKELSIECVRLDHREFTSRVHDQEITLAERGLELKTLDALIVRSMPPGSLEQVIFRMDLLGQAVDLGIRVSNSPRSLECAIDKYLTTARLARANLPVPATICCESEEAACTAFETLGGDVVVKPLFGSEGRGIVRVSEPDLAHRTFRTLFRLGAVLYVQKFIAHGGSDLRLMVMNGKLSGAMRRSNPNDFRTNAARSARCEKHEATAVETELALRAAEVIGTDIAGVDLLYDEAGQPYVLEVNAVPGWRAFGQATGLDVARAYLQFLQTT